MTTALVTTLVLSITIVVGALALWAVNRVIDADGLGHRPAPRSHWDDLDPRPSASHLVHR